MNEELIKRIDDELAYVRHTGCISAIDTEHLLDDCRAALLTQLAENESLRNQNTALDEKLAEISEKKYVPMTYDEMFSATNGLTVEDEAEHMRGIEFLHEDNFVDYARIIESLVILRAGLEVQE